MFSIRMRASKSIYPNDTNNEQPIQMHISGAEGIFDQNEIEKVIKKYLQRAMNHSRGKPDKIYFTIESLKQNPIKIPILSLSTINSDSPKEARKFIIDKLHLLGISKKVIEDALDIINSPLTMRGASLIKIKSGIRCEPDTIRGVRVSRLGIDKKLEKRLSRQLAKLNINTTRVKEALILASKVAYRKDIVAEICISDDPDYTTGYIASNELGYIRITNIKRLGDMNGGRVFFIKEDCNIAELINYLEKVPVLIT